MPPPGYKSVTLNTETLEMIQALKQRLKDRREFAGVRLGYWRHSDAAIIQAAVAYCLALKRIP